MSHRRIKSVIGIRYQDSKILNKITKAIESMLENNDDLDNTQTSFVNLINCEDSSLAVLIYCFTKTTNWVKYQSIQQDVLLAAIKIIEDNNGACAFPTRTIELLKNESTLGTNHEL